MLRRLLAVVPMPGVQSCPARRGTGGSARSRRTSLRTLRVIRSPSSPDNSCRTISAIRSRSSSSASDRPTGRTDVAGGGPCRCRHRRSSRAGSDAGRCAPPPRNPHPPRSPAAVEVLRRAGRRYRRARRSEGGLRGCPGRLHRRGGRADRVASLRSGTRCASSRSRVGAPLAGRAIMASSATSRRIADRTSSISSVAPCPFSLLEAAPDAPRLILTGGSERVGSAPPRATLPVSCVRTAAGPRRAVRPARRVDGADALGARHRVVVVVGS